MSNQDLDNMESSKDLFPGYDSFAEFSKEGYKALMNGIKQANSLPTGQDWDFYQSFDTFKSCVNLEANQIIDNINAVLAKNDIGGSMRNLTLQSKTERLIDANDIILERVANKIDEMNGIRKITNNPVKLQTVSVELPVNVNGSWNKRTASNLSVSFGKTALQSSTNTVVRLLTAENIVRPQKLFKDKIDNSNGNPWEPRIKEKPNSIKPLAIFLEESENGEEYSHPYLYELERFVPPNRQLTEISVKLPKLVSDTPLIEITNPEQLGDLVNELMQYDVIAVDLEHHSYRTFMGITCLMQISTKDKDYLIDTLALRSDLWILNEIFTKPNILKVFHGAVSDIQWLQRDLSLYVVNMFDTYFASKQLGYTSLSLAHLMQRFCKFIPNKQFQLADWRIRPLPDELKSYAREDTHYLIYIYENMSNLLLEKANGSDNILRAVYQQSTDLCKKRYFKPLWHEESHLEFYRRCNRMFDSRQMYALKELYKWRDHISRQEDESTGYVLPNNMLLEISERLPREMQGIIACCNPVPPLLRANLLDLHKIILNALEKSVEEPILKEDTRARGTTKKMSKINADNPLYCPHDLTKNGEFRDDLPTLLGIQHLVPEIDSKEHSAKPTPVYSLFDPPDKNQDYTITSKLRSFRENFKFRTPFERYGLIRPYIEAREKKMAEEKANKDKENAQSQAQTEPEMSITADNRTDEDRIESIKSHFLNLANQPNPRSTPAKNKQSLLEMGGSKKRKRDDLLASTEESVPQMPSTSFQTPAAIVPTLSFDNPTPNLKKNQTFARGQKRKFLDNQQGSFNKQQKYGKKNNKKFTQNPQGHNNFNNQQFDNIDNENGDNIRTNSDASQAGPSALPNKKFIRKKNNNRNNQNTSFSAYDYSMVDFRQFQGGAGQVQNPKQFKAKFKAKGNSKWRSRGNNKAVMFNNQAGNKRSM